jgi:hypothetical protein
MSAHPAVVGNVPKMVDIITGALYAEIVDAEITNRLVSWLQRVLGQCDEATRGTLWATLPVERQQFIVKKQWV